MEAIEEGKILVTGARGFIGRNVGNLLQREGYRVLAMDAADPPSGSLTALPGASVRELRCDIRNRDELQNVFERERISGIIHLAAILPTAAQRDPDLATQVNVVGSWTLLEMSRRFNVPRLVFGSSLSVYGTCPFDELVAEDRPAAPEDIYGAAKLYVEKLGEAYRKQHGIVFLSLRIGRVVGGGAHSVTSAWRSEIFELLNVCRETEITLPYRASEKLLLVHVNDVSHMLLKLLKASNPPDSVYNAVCESVAVGELKNHLESLNPHLRIKLGSQDAAGNPRLLDSGRFRQGFNFQTVPIFEQLVRARAKI
jgi:nucleoside-diphosphate-sugar epimerase